MQDNPEVNEDLGREGRLKNWLQDNIRIILSVLIVIAIAAGIYSYSKRGAEPEKVAMDTRQEEQLSKDAENKADSKKDVEIVGKDEKAGDELSEEEKKNLEKRLEEAAGKGQEVIQEGAKTIEEGTEKMVEEAKEVAKKETNEGAKPKEESKEKASAEEVQVVEAQQAETAQPQKREEQQSKAEAPAASQETGEAFVEKAQAGDSLTVLARKATAHYLEKNNDSELTAEHKVYIEDYLRKAVGPQRVIVGSEVSFSKNLIQNAVEKAKTLQPNQLDNLKRYSARIVW